VSREFGLASKTDAGPWSGFEANCSPIAETGNMATDRVETTAHCHPRCRKKDQKDRDRGADF